MKPENLKTVVDMDERLRTIEREISSLEICMPKNVRETATGNNEISVLEKCEILHGFGQQEVYLTREDIQMLVDNRKKEKAHIEELLKEM